MAKWDHEEIIRCEHTQCENCGHLLWVEYALMDGIVTPIVYDYSNEDNIPLYKCPSCKEKIHC